MSRVGGERERAQGIRDHFVDLLQEINKNNEKEEEERQKLIEKSGYLDDHWKLCVQA